MNAHRVTIGVQLIGLLAAVFITTSFSSAQTRGPWQREPREIVQTLDSLASVSEGPYVHFVVGSCLGGRCEQRVSIYRTSGETPFIYRAAAWVGPSNGLRWYGANREMSDEDAGAMLADARLAGIMNLIADTTALNNRSPRFWLRARFGRTAVHIDNASLGSVSYAHNTNGSQMTLFKKVESALVGALCEYYQESQ